MDEQEKLRASVAAGIALLDRKLGPGWEEKIDLDDLDMEYGEQCILGQLGNKGVFGTFRNPKDDGIYQLVTRRRFRWSGDRMTERFGFAFGTFSFFDGTRERYRRLTEAWREKIIALRARRKEGRDNG